MISTTGSSRYAGVDAAAERRAAPPQTPLGYLEGLPTTLILDRFPVPILAVQKDGLVVYVNAAFADMLGYRCVELIDRPAGRILADPAHADAGIAGLRGRSSSAVVDLRHHDGWTVHALVSSSALVRADDPVALVAVHDVTEQLWARTTFELHPGWSEGCRRPAGPGEDG
ncbi:PAS domain S-box protein [Antrihabitans cavernicola]|uniref:PAS domain S-box protein n=1 Tax=Antrihabitans cavernicola TaxID=2495913 RepID=A0A5A7S6M9_9NOCA|nr:PAS domain-containing protein [Spelaeibacter cavernicola]KAA0016550.1 PAS domain S-box protein [Spelaeibacter cavernicola]